MKSVKAGLLDNVVNVYDQTKTTIQGRITSKVIGGDTVLGPPLNNYIDTVADTAGSTVPLLSYLSPNGRLFSIGAEGSGISFISLHSINMQTGAKTFIGQIRMAIADLAATTHTFRGFKVIDDGTTGWRIFLATTGSVLINGGLYCVNNVDQADFLPVGSTLFPFATGSNQKATYLLQDPSNIGVNQLNIASAGVTLDRVNNHVFVHNGTAATHQFYVYSSNATLNCPLTTGLVIDSATDTVTQVGHTYLNNDPVFLTNLSGGAGLTNNTVYFVRNVTATTYQLSATSGGAVINITTNGTVDICRAFGTTGSAWVHKTGNLPALAGTLIQSDSEDYAVPGHTANAGQPCVFFCTTTNLYLGRLSELTPATTTWPNLVTSNLLGTPNQITTPTLIIATWSNVLDRAVYLTNTYIFVMKQVVNNSIDKVFGRISNIYRETFPVSETQGLGFINITAMDIEDGWLTVTMSATGQRGNLLCDLRSDSSFDYSYIVTKVLNTPASVYKFLEVCEKLSASTGSIDLFYRTSGFGSISGGWTSIPFGDDLTPYATGNQVQFKLRFNTLTLGSSIPKQLKEVFLGYESLFEISDNWEVSRDQSSNLTPSRVVFRLKEAYSVSVPTLYFRAYDLSNVLLVSHNSVSNAGNFEYSTDNGLSWLPLGTIPNVVGTLVRYTFTSPPGVDIRPSLKES
jgi:hypothetical protein